MKHRKKHEENLEWLIRQPTEMQYELFRNFVEIVTAIDKPSLSDSPGQ